MNGTLLFETIGLNLLQSQVHTGRKKTQIHQIYSLNSLFQDYLLYHLIFWVFDFFLITLIICKEDPIAK